MRFCVIEEEKFLDELTEMSAEGDSIFNRDSIFAQIAFTLTNGCVILESEESKYLLKFVSIFRKLKNYVLKYISPLSCRGY